MKLVMLGLLLASMLAGCQNLKDNSTEQAEQLSALKAELESVKQIQATIARTVGLGELVRPDVFPFGDGQRLGDDQAPIVALEFTDLHCPFCLRFQQDVWPSLKSEYVDKGLVQFIGKELPLIKLHKSAGFAAISLRCAAQQNKYEQAKGLLFAKGRGFDNEFVEGFPDVLEIDKSKFDACLKDIEQHNAITASIKMAQMLGVQSTPSFVVGQRVGDTLVNYQVITGAGSVEEFAKVFEQLSK